MISYYFILKWSLNREINISLRNFLSKINIEKLHCDHLETQLQVEIIDNSISYETLPDIQVTVNDLTANEKKTRGLTGYKIQSSQWRKTSDSE